MNQRNQVNMVNQINPNANTGSTNINLLRNPNPVQKKQKRNVSESKKKFIASNQKWKCAHCQNLLDNTTILIQKTNQRSLFLATYFCNRVFWE